MDAKLKPTLYIIRGLPGSGKSTYGRKRFPNLNQFEADEFFGPDYNWNPEFLYEAHKWCFLSALKDLYNGLDVVVANTFTTKKELDTYLDIDKRLDINIEVIEVYTQFESVHDVPDEVMVKMKNRWFDFPGNFKRAKVTRIE